MFSCVGLPRVLLRTLGCGGKQHRHRITVGSMSTVGCFMQDHGKRVYIDGDIAGGNPGSEECPGGVSM